MTQHQVESDVEEERKGPPTSKELTDEKLTDEIRSRLLGDSENKNIIRSMN